MSLKYSYLRNLCAFLAAAILITAPAAASLQNPPPSLQDFELKPKDEPANEPPSKVQGPVVDGQRPRDVTRPETQPQQPAPQVTPPARQQSAPETARPTPQTQRPSTQPAPAQQRPAQTQPSTSQQLQNAPDSSAPDVSDSAANDNGEASAPDATDAIAPVATDNVPQSDAPEAAAESTGLSTTLWALIALAIAAIGGLTFVMLRRRKAVAQHHEYGASEASEAEPVQPSPPVNLGGQAKITPQLNTAPAPKPAQTTSAPSPAPKPVPAPKVDALKVDNGGFVTSSLKATPQPQSTAPSPQPLRPTSPRPAQPQAAPYTPAPAASNSVGDMRIEFIAKTAGSTMMNAVLGYHIKLHNQGSSPMSNIALHGTMEQASGGNGNAPNLQMQPLHKIEAIAANDAEEVSGDIRVPLSGIKPIAFNNQALFVPVAHFLVEYEDADGKAHREHHAFIVGREHQPPREKMAPFRLDQGPGNFRPVGQRVLAT